VTSYEDARELVRRACEPQWQHGTFCLDDREIVQDAEIFVFKIGPRELLVDGDESFELYGGGIPVVEKVTGTMSWVPGYLLYDDHPKLERTRNPHPTLQV
jgi:hypothetical protein